jgi:threonine aldolase
MSVNKVDLRSDTLTLPTDEMKEAMAAAEVGDDVYGEDPTVHRLEELAAAKVGMEAALYVPSGTMGNTCALLAHANHGEEVIFEERAHMYVWECGAFANIAGLASRAIAGEHGIISAEQLREAIRGYNVHFAPTKLVCIENTHNNYAGSAWTPAEVQAIGDVCKENSLKLHMDGARLFNAAVAHGVEASAYTQHIDSVMFCVSKGLSGPVGSLLCGSRAFVDRAYEMRKRLGGAMRQAGIIAAAGIVAIETMAPPSRRTGRDQRLRHRVAARRDQYPQSRRGTVGLECGQTARRVERARYSLQPATAARRALSDPPTYQRKGCGIRIGSHARNGRAVNAAPPYFLLREYSDGPLHAVFV